MTQTVLLGDIVKIIKGISYRSSDYTVKGDGLAFINLKNVERSGGFRNDGVKYYKGDYKPNQIVIPGDILIANTDLTQNNEVIGSPIFMPDINELACFSLDLSKLEILNPSIIDKNYLFYYLKSPVARNYMVSHSNGSTVKHLSVPSIPKMTIKLPDLETQKKIAEILSSIDEKIELNRKMNETLEQMGQELFKHYFIDNPKSKNIPINGLLSFERGVEPGSKSYHEEQTPVSSPFLRVGDLGQRKSNIFVNNNLLKNKFVNPSDILVSFDGAPGLVMIGLKGSYSSGIRKIILVNNKVTMGYTYFLMKSNGIQNTIDSYSEGTTIKHASKSIDHMIARFYVNDDAMEKLQNILNLIENNLIQTQNLSTLRDILLPRLISEKIELKA